MKKTIYILAFLFGIIAFISCEENDDTPVVTNINYVGFQSDIIIGVSPTGTGTQEIKIATSNIVNNDRVFNIVLDANLTTADASAYTIPSSVTVPANSNIGTFNVDVVGENISPSGDDILAIAFASEDDLLIDESILLNLKQVCPYPETILDITFDDYPEEIYWKISDENGDTVFESVTPAGWGAYAGLTGGITKPICLANGTYTFQILDQFSDGAGPFSLTYNGAVIFSSNGAYGGSVSHTFTLP